MGGGKKQNPLLAKYEAMWEARYQQRVDMHNEVDRIALMLTVHEVLKVGPGRAAKVILAYQANRLKIAQAIQKEVKESRTKENKVGEILITRRDITKALRDIFGPDNWLKFRRLFPFTEEFWDWDFGDKK